MSDRDQQDEPETFTTCGEVFLCSIHEIPQPCMRDVGHPGSHRSKRDQQDEQATCFACGRGQAGDKHTCQQDECPKAFYCLPESCGDCPDQQLPCEGCPDPGMPCLGCPAVDEQATTEGMWFHLQHARWQMNPSSLRDQIDHAIRAKFGQNEVPGVSPMPPRTFAEGERAATERILKWLRVEYAKQMNVAIDNRTTITEDWEDAADAIERGEHE